MRFEWTDQLSTGIVDIDVQHKTLIKQVNGLLDACDQQREFDEIDRFLRFLAGYVRIHFGDEERLMARYAYPRRDEHALAHREFRREIEALRDGYQEKAVKEKAISEAVRLATDWLITHISKVDIEMARFVREKTP